MNSTFIGMNDKKKRIGVLGCGWLGMEVAIELVSNHIDVNGSTTTKDKIIDLKSKGINPYLLSITDKVYSDTWSEFLRVDALFINLPPTKASNASQSYANGFKKILPFIEKSEIKHVVFISATSVYKDNNGTVTEESALSTSDRAQRLIDAEHVFMNSLHFTTTIIRFSGLVGKDRNPVKFLSGKKEIEGKDSPVNLIHLSDCVQISLLALDNQLNEVFNAAADEHPRKKEYYNKMAEHYNLEPPYFDDQSQNSKISYKVISSDRLKKQFNYKFIYPDPLFFE
jgi:nucleoside-diphosphate-sugar epimerase